MRCLRDWRCRKSSSTYTFRPRRGIAAMRIARSLAGGHTPGEEHQDWRYQPRCDKKSCNPASTPRVHTQIILTNPVATRHPPALACRLRHGVKSLYNKQLNALICPPGAVSGNVSLRSTAPAGAGTVVLCGHNLETQTSKQKNAGLWHGPASSGSLRSGVEPW